MRPIHLIALLALAAGLCVGCGGGGNPNAPGQGSASASITIEWPQPERLIPLAANSIKVDITDGAGFNASQTVDRPAPPATTSTIRFDPVPVGVLSVAATAYPEAGGLGTAQATGTTTVTAMAGQNVSIGLTMASTIDRVEVTPASPFVYVGETVQLTATPKNAAGQVVLTVPGNITWSSANTGVATVDAGGLVTGVTWNTTDITATETESAKSASVTVTSELRPVLFSGPIAGSVTWPGRYRLTGDVTIPIGATLTIQPGTVVESMRRQDDQLGGMDTSRIEIIVDNGTLIAEGTQASPIVFTSWDQVEPPAAEDWYGLRLNGPTTTSRVRYCTQEYGIEGVRIEAGTPTVEYCTIRHNRDNGVHLVVSATLNYLTVTDSVNDGILVDQYLSLTLSNSTISNNGSGVNPPYAIFGHGVEAYQGTATVTASTVSSNGGDGVHEYNGTANVTSSTISNNGGDGVSAQTGTATISNSTLSNNVYSGVNVVAAGYDYYQVGTASVTNSKILRNGGTGIWIPGPAGVGTDGISGNLIWGNGNGIGVASYTTLTLPGGNDVFGSTEYELRNYASGAFSANGNYWGEPTTTELTNGQANLTKVYDSRDDTNVGQVAITSWSASRLTTFPLP